MISFIFKDLEREYELVPATTEKAEEAFSCGKMVYVKLAPEKWISLNITGGEQFDFEPSLDFYIKDEEDPDVMIVTRHKNLAAWFKSKGIKGKVYDTVRPKDCVGKKVYGVLPLYSIAHCDEFYNAQFANIPDEVDFDELSLRQLDELLIEVKRYKCTYEIVKL